ncbi:hypothetical protein L4C38_02400 [Vibrio kasasachensis]|uniref:hypothetical protein n=1 Tax=Vibrio kasasachensis TaxID=2910248 RepID=UPI003D0F5441
MRIEFKIFAGNKNWSAISHQINSDILIRNVLAKGQVSDINLSFTYDEIAQHGEIINTQNEVIGDFEVIF